MAEIWGMALGGQRRNSVTVEPPEGAENTGASNRVRCTAVGKPKLSSKVSGEVVGTRSDSMLLHLQRGAEGFLRCTCHHPGGSPIISARNMVLGLDREVVADTNFTEHL